MNTAVVYHRKISFTNENSIKHLNLKYEHRNIQNVGMSTIKKKIASPLEAFFAMCIF